MKWKQLMVLMLLAGDMAYAFAPPIASTPSQEGMVYCLNIVTQNDVELTRITQRGLKTSPLSQKHQCKLVLYFPPQQKQECKTLKAEDLNKLNSLAFLDSLGSCANIVYWSQKPFFFRKAFFKKIFILLFIIFHYNHQR